MADIYGPKKHATDKLALLGLFIVSLLIARSIVTSTHDQPLKAGSEIVAKIKSEGLNSFLDNQSQDSFFLIRDARARTIGFTMDILIDSGTDDQLNIQAASLLYARGRYAQEKIAFLQSDNNLDEFTWKSETVRPAGRSSTRITLDRTGIMTVSKSGTQPEEKIYQLNPAAIPDVFLEFVFSRILDSSYKKILVDTIDSDGRITPTLISKTKADKYVLDVKFLDGRGFSERVYLDKQKQIFRILLQQKNVFILERSSAENILREFPERADYILQRDKILEQNQQQ